MEIFASKVSPRIAKTLKGKASSSQTYTANPRYCLCDPISTKPRLPVHCRLCGSKLKELVRTDHCCLRCGKERMKTVKLCPKFRWWKRLIGIEHTYTR